MLFSCLLCKIGGNFLVDMGRGLKRKYIMVGFGKRASESSVHGVFFSSTSFCCLFMVSFRVVVGLAAMLLVMVMKARNTFSVVEYLYLLSYSSRLFLSVITTIFRGGSHERCMLRSAFMRTAL